MQAQDHFPWVLILTAFGTSTLAGVVGLGGGLLLFGAMAAYFPPLVLIPLHGVVQLSSNVSRALLGRIHLNRRILAYFFIGAVLGAATGSQVLIQLPEKTLRIALGVFVLVLTWMPKFQVLAAERANRLRFFLSGVLNSFVSLFLGATGPLLAAFFTRERLGKEEIVATQAACQSVVHALKIIVFLALGFSFAPHLPLLAGMVVASALGSYCARWILGKVPEKVFLWIFKLTVTALAIRLITR